MSSHVDVLSYLQTKGLKLKRAGGDEYNTPCFFCGEDDGKRGRLYINCDPGADIPGLFKCFLCEKRGALPTIMRHFGDEPARSASKDDNWIEKREILAESAAYYHECLDDHLDVLGWLKGPERGLTIDTISEQQLGYADGGLLQHLKDKGYRTADMVQTGLVVEIQGRLQDSLREMVTIPYFTAGNVSLIRGRKWPYDGAGAKYKTPAGQSTRLFNAEASWDATELIVTEGEFDCLSLKQLGFKNVVASPGANVWQDTWDGYVTNVKKLYVVFDNDPAGAQGLGKLQERFGQKVRPILLSPEGKCDPTDWVSRGGDAEQFERLLREAGTSGLLVTVDQAREEHALLDGVDGLRFGIERLDWALKPGILPSQVMIVLAKTGTGKSHPVDEPVPTPQGWRRWGDLEEGDQVFGRDGSATDVTGVFDRGLLPSYRVTFSDHSSILTGADHIWTVMYRYGKAREWTERQITTTELMEGDLRRGNEWRYCLPMAMPVQYPERDLPLDPYTLGSLIANGSLNGTSAVLTTPDEEVVGRVVGAKRMKPNEYCPRYVISGAITAIKQLGLDITSEHKFIPDEYLVASVDQRVALLQGLMDGDGSARKGRRQSLYHTTSEQLAHNVGQLVNSLGGTGSVSKQDRTACGKSVEYTVAVMLPDGVAPFSTSRKVITETKQKTQPRRAIVSVEFVGHHEHRCIQVSAADHLYLVGEQYIVTHNTILLLNMFQRICMVGGQENSKILFISMEQTRGDWWERARRIFRFYNPDAEDVDALDFWRDRLLIVDKNRLGEDQLLTAMDDFEEVMGAPPDLVAVDYLGYWAQGFKGDRYERTSDAVMSLKAIAKDRRVPIISPHQVSRSARYGEAPEADQARDAGVVEETADFLLTMWSPDATHNTKEADKSAIVKMKVNKSRHGGQGTDFELQFGVLTLSLVPYNDSVLRSRARSELALEVAHKSWEDAVFHHRTGGIGREF